MNPATSKYLAGIGRRGGKVKSAAKADAARRNGKLGGWPKGRPRKPGGRPQTSKKLAPAAA